MEGISRITVEMPYYLLGKRAMNGKYLNIPSLNPLMLLESSSSKEQGKSAAQRYVVDMPMMSSKPFVTNTVDEYLRRICMCQECTCEKSKLMSR